MQDHDLAALLPAVIEASWGRSPTLVEPLAGGMNSATARVLLGSSAYVAKWVPSGHLADLRTGLALARDLSLAGLPAGAPLPASSDALSVAVADGDLALLAWVAGLPLTGETPEEQRLVGGTLARAHRLAGPARPGAFFAWLGPDHPALDVEPGLRGDVAAVLAEIAALPPLTWGRLHTDPAPEAFLHDASTGITGLVDWAGACPGPLLYDIASAVMYLGGLTAAAPFLAAYADTAPLPRDELDHLPAWLRYRGAVQAAYFADRIVRADLTGTDAAGNRQGLAHGRRMLHRDS